MSEQEVFHLKEPGPDRDTGKPRGNWIHKGEALIVFLVVFLSVLALVYWLLGGDRSAGVALPAALALAAAAGVAAARTSQVRSGVISVLSFLQNISQLWR